KIVSYNIFEGTDPENIIKNITNFADQGVNFFCLQEVRPSLDKEFIGDRLLKSLGPSWKSEFFMMKEPGNRDYGLAMIWQTEVIESIKFKTISFAKLDFLSLYEQLIEFSQGNRTRPIQRGSLIGTFRMQGKTVRISNVHLDWHGGKGHRIKQLEQLVRDLKSEPEVDSEIICGDFNTVSFIGTDSHLQKIQSTLGQEFINLFPKPGRTARLGQHLDHIFARNLKLQDAKIQEAVGSDHFPVVASLTF
ncbi:MAG TPA: endonuclease/exonuclease/phosphatase family protein, partial [Patescibacteria group bacterium]